MSVTEDTVLRVAKLARIAVTPEDVTKMTGELSGILDWVEQLNAVDVTDVEPMTSVVETVMKKRDDGITDGGYPERVVGNAPAEEDHYFMVPKVVE